MRAPYWLSNTKSSALTHNAHKQENTLGSFIYIFMQTYTYTHITIIKKKRLATWWEVGMVGIGGRAPEKGCSEEKEWGGK